jgi:hypothetical protein
MQPATLTDPGRRTSRRKRTQQPAFPGRLHIAPLSLRSRLADRDAALSQHGVRIRKVLVARLPH